MKIKWLVIISISILLISTGIYTTVKGSFKQNHAIQHHHQIDALIRSMALPHNGDIVFRRGKSFESWAVDQADNKAPWSHVGIVYIQYDTIPMVIHAVPPDKQHPSSKIRMEPLQQFWSYQSASHGALYKASKALKSTPNRAAQEAYLLYQQDILFDNEYDLSDQSTLYCTELIWFAYNNAGTNLIANHFDTLKMPIPRQVILPSTIIESNYFKLNTRF